MMMFKKKLEKNAVVAVCPDESGIAIVRVRRNKESTANLELCQVQDSQNLSTQGAEIANLTRKFELDNQACITILELGSYSLLIVEAPEVAVGELQAAIRWRVKDLIDFNIDEAVVDVFEVPNQKVSGNGTLNAVVGRVEQIQQRIDILKEAGLNLRVIDIPEMAMRNVAALLPEDVAGMALLYLGRKNGLITITRQQTLYLSRRIDIGYDSFNAELDSEDLKMDEQSLDSIVVEIQRSMDYYERHFSQPALTNIVIAPLPIVIPNLEKHIQAQLGVACRLVDVNAIIDTTEPISAETQGRCFLAIGAALRDEVDA